MLICYIGNMSPRGARSHNIILDVMRCCLGRGSKSKRAVDEVFGNVSGGGEAGEIPTANLERRFKQPRRLN